MLEIKTKSDLFDSLVTVAKATHPYEVPEVIAFPMQYVSESYRVEQRIWIKPGAMYQ